MGMATGAMDQMRRILSGDAIEYQKQNLRAGRPVNQRNTKAQRKRDKRKGDRWR